MRSAMVVATSLVSLWLSIAVVLAEVRKIDYEGFTVWVDCDRRGPVLFHYVAEADSGRFPRAGAYKRDPYVPDRCQSKSRRTFGTKRGVAYDVGHQVPANHFDGSKLAIRQTNFWTNLLPQTASMNRGAWLETEYIIECIRDKVPLEVWGGPIWGRGAKGDFVECRWQVKLGDGYEDWATEKVTEQLAKAGHRLAAMLQEAMDEN